MQTESDLYFRQFAVGDMANLAYAIGSRTTHETLLVDPAWNVRAMIDEIEKDDMPPSGFG